jgi:hypothetical protein
LVVTALIAAAVAAGSGVDAAPTAAKRPAAAKAATFRQALAAKLGAQLHKPAADVLAAMKTAGRARRAGTTPADRVGKRADRLAARLKRLQARAAKTRGKAGKGGSPAKTRAARQAKRASRRAGAARKAHAARDAWAAALAKPLGVGPADVTAALRALVAQRLDSLVSDGWVTAERRDALLGCYDDAGQCQGAGRAPGLAFLRAGL